jgi:hypothetical protein
MPTGYAQPQQQQQSQAQGKDLLSTTRMHVHDMMAGMCCGTVLRDTCMSPVAAVQLPYRCSTWLCTHYDIRPRACSNTTLLDAPPHSPTGSYASEMAGPCSVTRSMDRMRRPPRPACRGRVG